jgi:hypothetical protein
MQSLVISTYKFYETMLHTIKKIKDHSSIMAPIKNNLENTASIRLQVEGLSIIPHTNTKTENKTY